MKVVNSRARIATAIIGQTTGLRVLAMLDTNPLMLSLFSSLLSVSGGTQRSQQTSNAFTASVNNHLRYYTRFSVRRQQDDIHGWPKIHPQSNVKLFLTDVNKNLTAT